MEKELHKEMLQILTKLESIHASIEHHLVLLNSTYENIKKVNQEIDDKGIWGWMGKYYDKKGKMRKASNVNLKVYNQKGPQRKKTQFEKDKNTIIHDMKILNRS